MSYTTVGVRRILQTSNVYIQAQRRWRGVSVFQDLAPLLSDGLARRFVAGVQDDTVKRGLRIGGLLSSRRRAPFLDAFMIGVAKMTSLSHFEEEKR